MGRMRAGIREFAVFTALATALTASPALAQDGSGSVTVEEIKRLLPSNGGAANEVEDVDGEFNVHVDAVTGRIMQINVEHRVIGRPAADDDDG